MPRWQPKERSNQSARVGGFPSLVGFNRPPKVTDLALNLCSTTQSAAVHIFCMQCSSPWHCSVTTKKTNRQKKLCQLNWIYTVLPQKKVFPTQFHGFGFLFHCYFDCSSVSIWGRAPDPTVVASHNKKPPTSWRTINNTCGFSVSFRWFSASSEPPQAYPSMDCAK